MQAQLCEILNTDILSIDFFTQGQIGKIYKIQTADKSYIFKTSKPSQNFQIEADMLKDINKYDILTPEIFDVSKTHLLMQYIPSSNCTKEVEEIAAAKIISDLHSVSNENRMYGYYYDTTIGPYVQKNEQTQYNWALFLAQMRIMPMAKICYDKGEINLEMLNRLEELCRDIYKRIDMNSITPSLLHGDLWSGNILFNINKAVFIDPALYFGDKEMELAFIIMFNTFGETFFKHYTKVHPLSSDFYKVKVPLYQIYPILVHLALYGKVYYEQLNQVLKRLKV